MESGQELDSDQYGRQEVENRQEVKMDSIREVYNMQEMYGGLEVEVYGGQEVEMDGIREVNDGPREGRVWKRWSRWFGPWGGIFWHGGHDVVRARHDGWRLGTGR
jgi:hypothetical protein